MGNFRPIIYCFAGDNRAELISALSVDQYTDDAKQQVKLIILANDDAHYQQLKKQAMTQLTQSSAASWQLPDIYYRAQPLPGKLAMVYATSNTDYADMGKSLTLAFPELVGAIGHRYQQLPNLLDRLYSGSYQPRTPIEGDIPHMSFTSKYI